MQEQEKATASSQESERPVAHLQEMLRTIYPNMPLPRDGIYGKDTRRAVMQFQREHQLPVTGNTDLTTWEALRQEHQKQDVLLRQAEPLEIVLQPSQVIELGSDNSHVYLVQGMLLAMGKYYGDLPPLEVSGVLDAPTAQAIVWLQDAAGLPQTGEIDKHTWRHLARQYRLIVGDGTGTFPVRNISE